MDFERLAKALEGPAYTAVGLGVLGFQRAQVYRVALQHKMGGLAGQAQGALVDLAHEVDQRTSHMRESAGDLAGEAVQHLPEPARDLIDAVGHLIVELPAEAKGLAQEAVALGRFLFQAAGSPAARFASRQGH